MALFGADKLLGGKGNSPALGRLLNFSCFGRDIERVMRTVREGGVQMPALGSTLTPEEIQDVSAYVVERLVQ